MDQDQDGINGYRTGTTEHDRFAGLFFEVNPDFLIEVVGANTRLVSRTDFVGQPAIAATPAGADTVEVLGTEGDGARIVTVRKQIGG
jgi:hypothetical protein